MEVKVLKLSSSFYFADFDQLKSSLKPKSKIIWRLNPLALNIQCKTFQFCNAGKIVSKFIVLLLTFYTRSLCIGG